MNNMKKIAIKTLGIFSAIITSLASITVVIALLSFNIKGDVGSPLYYQTELDTKLGGPFESSGSTSRYALTKSIVDTGKLTFNTDLAKFASPDVVRVNEKYSTLFTPGVSFAAVPMYYLGKTYGFPQLGAFLTTTLFAAMNVFLIYLISRKFDVNRALSIVSGLIFGFATSAMAYSNTMTQHHLSVFLLLLGILNASSEKRNFINNLLFGFIAGFSVLVDIPNLFMMIPIGLYILARNFSLVNQSENLKLKMKLSIVALLLGVVPMFGLFGWYNYQTTGSYTKLAQSIGRTDIFATDEIKQVNKEANARAAGTTPPVVPFETRAQLNGFYILLISDERGIFYYNPIVIFGILGLLLAVKNKIRENLSIVILSIVMVNILLYSMFGDPWGGWSFGPRYLIPSIALLCTGIGYALSRTLRNPLVVITFIVTLVYSILVNVLGSTTTNLVPPKVEALNLAVTVPHTYFYNIQLAQAEKAGVLIYNLFLRNSINVQTYIYIYSGVIALLILTLYFASIAYAKNTNTVDQLKRKWFNFKLRRNK